MAKFFSITLQDPILLITGLFLLVTIAILIWAVKKLKDLSLADEFTDIDLPLQPPQSVENSGLQEARLQEVINQLHEISQRLFELEKSVAEKKSADQTQTVTALPNLAELEEAVGRIEARLGAMSAERASALPPGDYITRLEGKLEGIHKLLILLTDSGSPDQK